jgi:DNA-binding transcriptional ArsR family regulator
MDCQQMFAEFSLQTPLCGRSLGGMDERTAVTPDAAGLKALGHPIRLRMLGLLRIEGPATATSLATRLGLNTGATSYHLRQLAQHGFIEEDTERGNARDRWWRAAHQSTHTGSSMAGPEEADAHEAYSQALAVFYGEQLQNAVSERMSLPADWLATTTMSDWNLKLTPRKAEALLEALFELIEDVDEEAGADGAGDYVIQLATFPRPGTIK